MKTNIEEVLRDDFKLSDSQIKEVLELIKSDDGDGQKNSLENYLLKDIVPSNKKTKKISFETLKEALQAVPKRFDICTNAILIVHIRKLY